jgi:hypothetical protein
MDQLEPTQAEAPTTPTISRAPQAQAGAAGIARLIDAWKKYRFGNAQTPKEYALAYGGVDLAQPDKPVQSVVTNPKHGVAQLVARMMPKAYKVMEDAPEHVTFGWLPGGTPSESLAELGATSVTPSKRIVMEMLSPSDLMKGISQLSREAQAGILRMYPSTLPHEVGHVLDVLKRGRVTGAAPELNTIRVTPNTIQAAERIMAANPQAAEAFKQNVAHYFPIIQRSLGVDTETAVRMATRLAHNEVLVQAGAETATRNILKAKTK